MILPPDILQFKQIYFLHICYLSFFTGTIFREKNYTENRVNYDKRISRQNRVNRDILGQADNNCM